MDFHNASRKGQAQTESFHGTTARDIDTVEALKYILVIFGSDPRTIVSDFQYRFAVRMIDE